MDEQTKASTIFVSFPRSSAKREMMCRRLEILQQVTATGDIDSIQMVLGDFLMEARSLHDVIKREGDHLEGFRAWWAGKMSEVEADPLMKWAHEARKWNFHEGIPSIQVTGLQIQGGFEYDPQQKSDTKNLVVRGGEMFWYSAKGTVEERFERARITADNHSLSVHIPGLLVEEEALRSLEDIPKLCGKIARRNQELLHEVKEAFGIAALYGPGS